MPGVSGYEIAHVTLYKVHQRVEAAVGDVAIPFEIPLAMKQRMRIATFRVAVLQIVRQRLDTGLRDVGIPFQIPRNGKERARIAPFAPAIKDIMENRIAAGRLEARIGEEIVAKIENAGTPDKLDTSGQAALARAYR